MQDAVLDNPFWSSLSTIHRALALGDGGALRFPPEYAPFLGLADARAADLAALEALVEPGESVYLLGIAPGVPPPGWTLEAHPPLAQMVCEAPIGELDGPDILRLGDTHRADVLALTAKVYPHYFRPRTMDLGRYYGLGYARRLTAFLANGTLRDVRLPFLHVSHANTRAKALYARMGFVHRRDIGFWTLTRG